jgi:hypothetical protein
MEIHIQRREEALKAYRDQPRYPSSEPTASGL